MPARKPALVLCAGFVLAFAFVAPPIAAQPAALATAPIACFEHAADQVRLARSVAIDLCLGASSDAPARCAAAAIDVVHMTDSMAVQLCRGAISAEPAQCAVRLDDLDYTDQQIVQFCKALPYPLMPAPGGGSPECVDAANDRTKLSDGDIVQLCAGSTSSAPVACFESGDAATTLADRELVTLCASMSTWPYGFACSEPGQCTPSWRSLPSTFF